MFDLAPEHIPCLIYNSQAIKHKQNFKKGLAFMQVLDVLLEECCNSWYNVITNLCQSRLEVLQ